MQVLGVRGDTIRPIGGEEYFRRPPAQSLATVSVDTTATTLWMFGRTLYGGHPGGFDASFDAFELESVADESMRGRFHRSWGIAIPVGVSGDSAEAPAGYFCGQRVVR